MSAWEADEENKILIACLMAARAYLMLTPVKLSLLGTHHDREEFACLAASSQLCVSLLGERLFVENIES